MIEKGINRKFFKEDRLEPFFEQCFALPNPKDFLNDKKFHEFVYTDLKYLLQVTYQSENLMQWSKFIVFF